MNVSALLNPTTTRGLRARRAAGFTLVEIMIVVVIISMLAAFGIPTMVRMQLNARTAAITNDFRVFAQVFQSYAHANGTFPDETAAGVIPPELTEELNNSPWARPTPLAGFYNWENNQLHQGGFRPRAAITITLADGDPPITVTQMQHIDDFMDDGNLDTGNFRRGAGNAPLYIIEP